MPQIQLLKEPGYVYDLNFIFYLKFNLKRVLDNLPDEVERAEAVKFYEDILVRFGNIPDDLYVFYHAGENGCCFLSTHYIEAYGDKFTSGYNVKFLLHELNDQSRLIRNLLSFYLYDLSEEEIEACMRSQVQLYSYIKDSGYSDTVKSRLYEFLVNPLPYIQSLQYELMHKDVLLEEYYKENYEKILDVHNQSSYEAIRDNMRGLTEVGFLEKTRETLYVSYCLLNKFSIWFIPIADGMVGIMGVDYLKAIGFIKTLREDVNLRDFSNALSDENRIKIVDMLLEREEIICKDLERIFDFSGSTAYHHITILTKAGVLKTRNDKKTILYSLNRKYFDNVIQALRKYSSYRKG